MVPETSGVRFSSQARKSLSPMTFASVNLFAQGKKTPATRDYSPFPGSQRLPKKIEQGGHVKLSPLCRHRSLVFRTVRESFPSHGSPQVVFVKVPRSHFNISYNTHNFGLYVRHFPIRRGQILVGFSFLMPLF